MNAQIDKNLIIHDFSHTNVSKLNATFWKSQLSRSLTLCARSFKHASCYYALCRRALAMYTCRFHARCTSSKKRGASSCTLSLRPPNTFTNSFLRLRASLAFPWGLLVLSHFLSIRYKLRCGCAMHFKVQLAILLNVTYLIARWKWRQSK